jgi:hypothetical protein
MTISPRLLKAGIVLIDPQTNAVLRVIALQYNPDSLSRSLQVRAAAEGGDRSEALRVTGPPVETLKLEAEIDAADQLEAGDPVATAFGIHPQLAALETILYPSSAQLEQNNDLAQTGTLEIVPTESPLALFVFGRTRVVPVRLTDFSVTEEAFDPALNPIRAKVSLGMRVLSVDDVGFDHPAGGLFMSYLQQKESLAQKIPGATIGTLGLTVVP